MDNSEEQVMEELFALGSALVNVLFTLGKLQCVTTSLVKLDVL